MLYGSVNEKSVRVGSVKVLAHRWTILSGTPSSSSIIDFDANTFNTKYNSYIENIPNKSKKYWRLAYIRFTVGVNNEWTFDIFYTNSHGFYTYEIINSRLLKEELIAIASQWGIIISPTISSSTTIGLTTKASSTEIKPLKVMYGSRNNRTKTIFK